MSAHFWNSSKSVAKGAQRRPVLLPCLLHVLFPRHRRFLGAGFHLNQLSRFQVHLKPAVHSGSRQQVNPTPYGHSRLAGKFGRPKANPTGSVRFPSCSSPASVLGSAAAPCCPASDCCDVLLRSSRLCGIELPIALFDAAGPLVPGNRGADMVRASALACSGDSCCVLPVARART